MNTQTELERFIIDELLSGSRPGIKPDEPLTSGLIDSLGTLRLITFLEEKYGIQVGDGEVGDENFGTLGRLQAFVDRKRGERAP